MELDPQNLAPEIRYKILTGTVVPRPIAVVSSQSAQGHFNIAPFSFFNVASHNPMTLFFSISGPKPSGDFKDTLRNVRPESEGGLGEFVVNIATENYASELAKTASSLPYEQSEFEFAGLSPLPSSKIRPPRIGQALVSYECKTSQIVTIGQSFVVFGEVVYMHLADDIVVENYRINQGKLKAIGRMAGSQYTHTSDVFELNDNRGALPK